jgi:hypothetical protein
MIFINPAFDYLITEKILTPHDTGKEISINIYIIFCRLFLLDLNRLISA